MPARKKEGWKTRCGLIISTKIKYYKHNKSCAECQEKMFTTGVWIARCGQKFKTKKLLNKHQPICKECQKLAWKLKDDGTWVEHKTRCGIILNTRSLLETHQKNCAD